MNTFTFYRKVVALESDVQHGLNFSANEVDFSSARDTTYAPIAGVGFVESAPSANA
jgi:hypothetical protein